MTLIPDSNASNSSCKDTGLPEGLKSFLNPDITFPLVVAIPGATPVIMWAKDFSILSSNVSLGE